MNVTIPIRVIPEAKASSQYSKELIDIQLKRTDLPEEERKYLLQLKERKYGRSD